MRSPAHTMASVEHLREAVHGNIVLLSVLVVLSERKPPAPDAALAVAGTSLILFFAQVYSGALAEWTWTGARPSWERVRQLASVNWPLVAVIAWPLVLLGVAAVTAMRTSTAVMFSMWLAVAALGLFGWRAAGINQAPLRKRLLTTALNLLVGLTIVLLKAAFH